MTTIVLNSLLRSTIRFNSAMNSEAKKLGDLNASGQLSKTDNKGISAHLTADNLNIEVNELSHQISQVNKAKSTLNAAQSGIKQMRTLLERVESLEQQRDETSDLVTSASITDQIQTLREEMITIAQSASYQGKNLLTSWGSEDIEIGKSKFSLQSMNIEDIAKGRASLGGAENILNIQDGKFDTSSYPDLIAAFGADIQNGTFVDYAGNFPDASMVNGAYVSPNAGYNGATALVMDNPTNLSRSTGGPYAELPDLTLPSEFTISTWARMDTSGAWNRIFDFSNGVNQFTDSITLTRIGTTDRMGLFVKNPAGGWFSIGDVDGAGDPLPDNIGLGEWAHWSVTAKNVNATDAEIALYKNGELIQAKILPNYQFAQITRTENYLANSWDPYPPSTDGAISDFVVMKRAFDATEVNALYDDLGLSGVNSKFFSILNTDTMSKTLDKMESYFANQQVTLEAMTDQLSFKQNLAKGHITDLLSIDKEQTATELNIIQTRQQLSMVSIGIASQVQGNIMQLFR